MRKLLTVLALAAAMALPVSALAADLEIKDMSKDHWAYKSVQMLLQKGYLALYDNGEFRGSLPVTREVFAAALAKLIDQIRNGELKVSGADMAEIKKLSDAFKNEISDYESRVQALSEKLEEIKTSGVIQGQDLSKAMVEYRDGFDKMTAENKALRKEVGMLTTEVSTLNAELDRERKDRKTAQTMLWIGVIAAVAAGLAGN